MKCYSCGKERPLHQDYRERDGTLSKYASCGICFGLNDEGYFRQADRTYRKQKRIGHVVITVERKGMSSAKLVEAIHAQLDKCDILPDDPKVEVIVEGDD